jgi:hypothetical protein
MPIKRAIVIALYAACVGAALTIPTAFAQAPTSYHPGQTVSFNVTFEGIDVSKLTGAQLTLDMISSLHDDQAGFVTQININPSHSTGVGSFEISMVIPDNQGSGTYRLASVSTGTPNIGFSYRDGLPTLTITIDNPNRFTKPALKSVKETSRP